MKMWESGRRFSGSEFYAGLFVYTNSTTVSFSEEKAAIYVAIAVVYGWKKLDEKRKMVLE